MSDADETSYEHAHPRPCATVAVEDLLEQTPTLRDYFAMSVVGDLAAFAYRLYGSREDLASEAYKIADAMLKVRGNK